jgi:4'-phosphopantetheinyl transferase
LFQLFTQRLDWPHDTALPEILSAEERERCARFVRAADRARFAQAHVFLRETLSRFADVAASEWEFSRGEFGKPAISSPPAGAGIEFNLSHTRDWAACVVTRGVQCGIDIERIRPVPQMLDIARSRFAPQEFHALEALPEDARPQRFFELWTEKEAWVKARGKGLSLPIDRVVSEIPGVTLQRFQTTPDHTLALVLLD